MDTYRNNETYKCGDILNNYKSNLTTKPTTMKTNQPTSPINAENLLQYFLKEFKIMFGVDFIQNPETMRNLLPLIYYFARDKRFFNCQNLRTDITKYPSFDKGLLIMGGYGTGKTDYLKVFEKLFKIYAPHRFKMITTKDVVRDFESCQTPNDKAHYYDGMYNGKLALDDVGSERKANNFGANETSMEILEARCDRGLITHITCNYAEGGENDVKESLLALNMRYGGRVYDRIYDHYSIIEFKGKSMRGNIKR
jgi:DNA replication protein DnaC